jgi:hypothetical protein
LSAGFRVGVFGFHLSKAKKNIRCLNLWLGKSPLFPHSQTFRFFAYGAFVLEPWTNAINGKKLSAPDLNLWICSKEIL